MIVASQSSGSSFLGGCRLERAGTDWSKTRSSVAGGLATPRCSAKFPVLVEPEGCWSCDSKWELGRERLGCIVGTPSLLMVMLMSLEAIVSCWGEDPCLGCSRRVTGGTWLPLALDFRGWTFWVGVPQFWSLAEPPRCLKSSATLVGMEFGGDHNVCVDPKRSSNTPCPQAVLSLLC